MKNLITIILIIVYVISASGQVSRFRMYEIKEQQDNESNGQLRDRYPLYFDVLDMFTGFRDGVVYAHKLFERSNIFKRLLMRTGIMVEPYPDHVKEREDPYYYSFRMGYHNVFNFSSIEKILIAVPIIHGTLFIGFMILDWMFFQQY